MELKKRALFWAAAALLCFAMQCKTTRDMRAVVPEAVVFSSASGLGVSVEQAQAMPGQAAAMGEQIGTVELPSLGRTQTVRLFPATSNYAAAVGMRFSAGGWFGTDAVHQHRAFAVISDALALELLGSDQAVGAELLVQGEYYQICGIYRAERRFWPSVCAGELPRVYLSRPVEWDGGEFPATQLLCPAEQSTLEQLRESIQAAAGSVLNGEAQDLRCARQFAVQLCLFTGVGAGLWPLLRWMNRGIKSMITLWREKEKTPRRFAVLACCALRDLAGPLAIVWEVGRLVRLPQSWLPPDQIFDLEWYLENIRGFYQALFSNPQQYQALIGGYLPLIAIWGAAALVCCLAMEQSLFLSFDRDRNML